MVYYTFSLYVILLLLLDARMFNSTSEEVAENVENFEFPDFETFMAPFRKYKKDMSEEDKATFLTGKLEEIIKCANLKEIIYKIFDYDLEVAVIEAEIFSNATLMETVFNFMDVSFKLYPDTPDSTFAIAAGYMNDLRKKL